MRKNLFKIWLFVIFLLGMQYVASLCLIFIKYPISIFQWDEWDVYLRLQNYLNGNTSFLNFIFSQHNEHIPAFSNAIFYLWVSVLKNNLYIYGWCAIFFLVIEWLIYLKIINLIFLNKKYIYVISLFSIIFIMSDLQIENLIRIFNLQVMLVVLFACLSFYFICTNNAKKIGTKLFLSIFFAFCSSFSMAGGLGAWLVLLFYLLFVIKDKKFFIVFLFSAIICFFIFFNKYSLIRENLPHHTSEITNIIWFSFAFVGNQLIYFGFIPSLIAGFIGIVCFFISILINIKYSQGRAFDFLFLSGLFSLILAIEVSIGRSNFGLTGALASRYLTFSAPFWVSLTILAFLDNGTDISIIKWARYFQRGVVLVVLLLVLVSQGGMLNWVDSEYIKYQKGATALFNDVPDTEILELVHPSGSALIQFSGSMKDTHIAPFSNKNLFAYNKIIHLVSDGKLNGKWCNGSTEHALDKVVTMGAGPSFLRASGWGWNWRFKKVPDYVLFLDEKNLLIGSGNFFMFYNKNEPAKYIQDLEKLRIGWYGYVHPFYGQKFSTYIYSTPESELCLIN